MRLSAFLLFFLMLGAFTFIGTSFALSSEIEALIESFRYECFRSFFNNKASASKYSESGFDFSLQT